MLKLATGLLFLASVVPGQAQPTVVPVPFEREIEAFAVSDRQTPPGKCRLLFVGSSSIRMWESLARDMAPHGVINRGFGGSTISDVNLHFERVVAPYRPRAIFFYAGENDISAGRSPQQVVADFSLFLGKKTKALGAARVYFISLKPSRARFDQLAKQQQVNSAVRRIAKARADLVYVDVASVMLEKGRPRDIYQEDALHMTDAGYRIWTRILRPHVSKAARHRCTAKGR